MLNRLQAEKRENDNLLIQFLARFPGVTKQHLHDVFNKYHEESLREIKKSYDVDYIDMTLVQNGQPYVVNYKNRRHLFLWCITNFTATIGTYGSFSFVAGNWYNISFRDSTPITLTSATSVNILVKATNEVIP